MSLVARVTFLVFLASACLAAPAYAMGPEDGGNFDPLGSEGGFANGPTVADIRQQAERAIVAAQKLLESNTSYVNNINVQGAIQSMEKAIEQARENNFKSDAQTRAEMSATLAALLNTIHQMQQTSITNLGR